MCVNFMVLVYFYLCDIGVLEYFDEIFRDLFWVVYI